MSFLDSDDLDQLDISLTSYRESGGTVVCWSKGDEVCTEQRIINDIPFNLLDSFLALAIECFEIKRDGELTRDQAREKIISQIRSKMTNQPAVAQMQQEVRTWGEETDIRNGIGLAAKKGGWFKRIDVGKKLGVFICSNWTRFPNDSDLILKLTELKTWVYR